MMLKQFLAAALLLLTTCLAPVQAQILPLLDQNPSSLRWYQVRTPHFQVLYPAGFAAQAQLTAQRLEQVYGPVSASLEREPRPLTVILQTQTTIGNGFATVLPRRSEFYTTPPQDPFLTGTLDWLDQLAIHEFRHIVQYDKGLQGITKLAYSLFGNGALSTATIGMPDWFFEGDAVGTETLLTRSGRGRIPNFDISLRANLLAGRRFNYSKAVGGSYRDNVPNHYVLGYFLTTNLKRTIGPAAWSQVLNRYYRFPVYPFSFSNSLRRTAGVRVEDLYARTMSEVDSMWRAQQQSLQLTAANTFPVAADPKIFTQYRYPQYVTDSTVLTVKTGLGDISQLVLLDKQGREKKVFVQGLVNNPEMLSVGGGRACWLEFRYDARWGQRVYSEIRVLDLASGELTHLTRRSRYTTAALSGDGQRLVAVRSDSAYQNRLVVLDARSGQEQRVLPNPNNDLYIQPRWLPDQRTVAAVLLKPGGKTLALIDTETGQTRELLPVANNNLSHPQPGGNFVFYNSPQSGIDNVYAVEISTGQVKQVTSRPLGAYHAAISPDGRRLAFHDFRVEGARVAEMPLEPTRWTAAPAAPVTPPAYTDPLLTQEPGLRAIGAVVPDSATVPPSLAISRYNRFNHLFNVFSWGLVQSPDGQGVKLGVRSQDLLSTTVAVAGVGFDQTERTGNVFADLSYQGFLPVLDLSVQHGSRRTTGFVDRRAPLDSASTDRWRYTQFTTGVRLPLNFTRSKYLEGLTLGAHYSQQQVRDYDLRSRRLSEVGFAGSLHIVQYSLSYYHQLLQSRRDVAPRWGQNLSAVWRTTPFGVGLQGQQWAVQGNLYFPGVLKHHSLRLRGGYQYHDQSQYQFSSLIAYPRGQSYVSFDKLQTGSVEYRLPVADTHWTLGRWLYIQRIKAGGFLDVATGQRRLATDQGPQNFRSNYTTAGLDVSFVFNPMRLRTPLEVGVRSIYNLRTGQWEVQPLVLDIGF
ncbi:hypothetical protein [Hymenobacter sp. BT188]|uniref:hypothetical protein n=1 Tax=Hymenobacter sp. BT188 TaxID=2763504 RepID=UPI0021C6F4F4|nr:hypothetical protein [Hymenobacter sp. BT188]